MWRILVCLFFLSLPLQAEMSVDIAQSSDLHCDLYREVEYILDSGEHRCIQVSELDLQFDQGAGAPALAMEAQP